MSTMTISPSMPMPMRSMKIDRNLLLTLAVALLGLAVTAVMLPLFDPASVAALGMLG